MLRPAEWLLISYFAYVALVSAVLPMPQAQAFMPFAVALAVPLVFYLLAFAERFAEKTFSIARDWVVLTFLLMAYRQMDWFTPAIRDRHFEQGWILWDRLLLDDFGLRRAIESLGVTIPGWLELCYSVVYAVGPFSVAAFYVLRRRPALETFLFCYAAGTLLCYALFPYFPSDPPRVVFADQDLPNYLTAVRRFNLWLVNGAGIHSSVFPSAHVSSACAAALGVRLMVPDRPKLWIGMSIYAFSVLVATIYGRYHYAVDGFAGVGVGVTALCLTWVARTFVAERTAGVTIPCSRRGD